MDPLLDCGVPLFIDALPRAGVSASGSTSGISCDNCNSVVNGACTKMNENAQIVARSYLSKML